MRAILSPAKSLNAAVERRLPPTTVPRFLSESTQLATHMRDYDPPALAKLMHLSDKLAALNVARFGEWTTDHADPALLPALFAFNGDVYQGLDATTLSDAQIEAAQNQIRILSGLYGLLRPLDALRPYRLEMGTKLTIGQATSLAQFWRPQVTGALNAELQGEPLLNLASQEYADAVDFGQIASPVISPVFKDWKNGQYKIISFFAKRARGLMARFVVTENPRSEADLKDFSLGGYRFDSNLSTPGQPVFTRNPEQQ